MQNQQTPKWLDLFYTAFGAQGLVALAWWAGAYHSESIRRLQGTFPFLHINGDAGSGKSTLVDSLWKLSGITGDMSIKPSTHSFGALIARLTKAINVPLVIEESDSFEPYDWNSLKACYQGGTLQQIGDRSEVRFRGALAIVANGCGALSTRSIRVQLQRATHSVGSQQAAQALYELHVSDLAEFLTKTQANPEMAAYCMGKAESIVDTLSPPELPASDARNHAQMLALLDFLDVLFHIPADALTAAQNLVREMAWHTVGATRGPVED